MLQITGAPKQQCQIKLKRQKLCNRVVTFLTQAGCCNTLLFNQVEQFYFLILQNPKTLKLPNYFRRPVDLHVIRFHLV